MKALVLKWIGQGAAHARAGWIWIGQSRARQASASVALVVGLVVMSGTGYGYESFDSAAVDATAAVTGVRRRRRQLGLGARGVNCAPRSPARGGATSSSIRPQAVPRYSGKIILEAVCSAGSGFVLGERRRRPRGLDTPRGGSRCSLRIKNPIWQA
jgi:hypothetical protein